MHLGGPPGAELLDRTDASAPPGSGWLSEQARLRIGCDAILQRLDVDRLGVPLRLGRSARVVPPALRRVIDVRDRHCTFAGCVAPAIRSQAHHLVHWEHGGRTDERNLVLLCQFHHRAVHERGFQIRWSHDGTRVETLRPDGTLIEVCRAHFRGSP